VIPWLSLQLARRFCAIRFAMFDGLITVLLNVSAHIAGSGTVPMAPTVSTGLHSLARTPPAAIAQCCDRVASVPEKVLLPEAQSAGAPPAPTVIYLPLRVAVAGGSSVNPHITSTERHPDRITSEYRVNQG
jgi:hypothetical protein